MTTSVVTTLLVGESVEIVNPEDTPNADDVADDALSAGVVVVATTQEILAVCVGKGVFIL